MRTKCQNMHVDVTTKSLEMLRQDGQQTQVEVEQVCGYVNQAYWYVRLRARVRVRVLPGIFRSALFPRPSCNCLQIGLALPDLHLSFK